ncbi:sugar phosphate isomerase/epimerase [Blastopirellula sp. J2-11]|uniref:sugar phosphate isomerase/epimerase family protein n=1 Tax=Blastopirellula sp. J2-11 TaxID=2943192 RepID=UPI0021C9E284|nr:sugar phosphate isomerase/epimerase family protein [Blastopirellula sp. J2-11]UUO08682.1 sugar phosphate isomerase/epimerase [Blastopirellula sp. J2-11]
MRVPLLAINQLTTFRWSFEMDARRLAEAGIPGVHVWRQKLVDYGVEKGAHLLEEYGLKPVALSWAGGFTGSDGRTFADALSDGKLAIEQAAELQAPIVVVHSGSRGGHTVNHARRLFLSALGELLPLAEEHDIQLAVEPMHPAAGAEWTFLQSLADAIELTKKLESDHLKIVADVYQLFGEKNLIEQLKQATPYLALVQLADADEAPMGEPDRRPLGSGKLPLREIVTALQSAGYEGAFDVELMGLEIENTDYDQLISQTRGYFNDIVGATTTPQSQPLK